MFGATKYSVQTNNGIRYLQVDAINKTGRAQTIVLLHGMLGRLSNYDGLIEQMQDCRLLVPEIPLFDYGCSKLSIRNLTSWLHSFIKENEVSRPVLVGNSMGGHLALNYTMKHADNVSALVLTGSSGIQEKDFGSSFPRRKDRSFIQKQVERTFYKDIVNQQIVDDIMEVITTPSKLVNLLAIARDTYEYNLENSLDDITKPTLLIWGKNDNITPPKVAHKFHNGLQNSELRWIDKCGHVPMMEYPEKFASFLKDFLLTINTNAKYNTLKS